MEESSRQNTDDNKKTLGLSLSDADYYNVNASAPEPEKHVKKTATPKRRGPGFAAAFIAGALCCAFVLFAVTELFGLGKFVAREKYDYYRDLDAKYGKYYEIMKLISEDPLAENEVGEISDDELRAIVDSTGDPYAQYYTAEEYTEFMKRYSGDYIGIGIAVIDSDEGVIVMGVYEDSPAMEAGIQYGDVLTGIDGKTPADVDEAVELLSGEPGTPVTVTVRRGEEELDFKLNRAKIDQESVEYHKVGGTEDIGYIKISSFIQDTDKDFKAAVKELKNEGCTKIIIDLRNNGGGLTDPSIEIADYLLPTCRIMSETTKSGAETVYSSKPSSAGVECAVLVNGGTASASEILTAALQDNNGAVVIGSKTYGKGVTQLTHRFDDGSAVKLTVTEYFRPNGKPVNDVGITPDIEAADNEAMDKALEELGH